MKTSIIIILIATVLFVVGGLVFSDNVKKANTGADIDTISNNLNK